MLATDRTVLMLVDVQGKLAQLMHDRDSLFRNLQILVRGAQILGVPILWLEQNPAGLGATIPELASLLANQKPLPKMSFSGYGEESVRSALQDLKRTQVLLAGIEAHVCIYLTAADLLSQGYEVEVVADAVSSRTAEKKQMALAKVAALGAGVSCTETVLFELLQRAEGTKFKEIVRLVK
jgi:nicotinamidase-related amidase